MKLSKEIVIITIIKITEILGFSLILPFLPFYAQDLGASPFQVGLILTSFSLFQFFSAPIMGKLSDRYGRKPLLILSQISTFLSFVILAFAGNLWMIFLSRAVDGILGSNYTIAQAYLSDISTKKNRSKVFAVSGIAFSIGFLFGPAIGGILSQFGYWIPSTLAAILALITIFITARFLPETIKTPKKVEWNFKIFEFDELFKYLQNKTVAPQLGQFFTYLLAHALFVSNIALYTERQIGFGAKENGLAMAFVGLVNILFRLVLPKIIDRVEESKLKLIGFSIVGLSLLSLPLITAPWMFFVVICVFALSSAVTQPLMNGSISKSVSNNQQGEIMGVTSSLQSISQIIGPLVGGILIQNYFPGSIGVLAGIIMFGGVFLPLIFKKQVA